ncbi:hypothetical protein GIB67_040153 [Kingdonia uniflora]|uniref:F-box domain-containing protein n=1 Tax=Kingdonia uniflora TaxID=39325 RepID=A0A7J7MUP0_9MAGN|nr:hypothetical protein GIB67_040153 [Kingdonia uniflora]
MDMSSPKPSWLDLPDHLVSMIFNKISSPTELIRFGYVCTRLQSLFTENHKELLHVPVHRKLKHEKTMDVDDCSYKMFKIRDCGFELTIHPASYAHCSGSSYGWLVLQDNPDYTIRLLNPFLSLHNEIQLPTGLINNRISMAVLSVDPSWFSEYAVMAINLPMLYKIVDTPNCKPNCIYWISGMSRVFNLENGIAEQVLNHAMELASAHCIQPNLQAKVILITKVGNSFEHYNKGGVFKLDSVKKTWVKLNDLCGHSIFMPYEFFLHCLSRQTTSLIASPTTSTGESVVCSKSSN